MSANTLGDAFRATTFGESHGAAVGVVVDGCPAGLPLAVGDIQADLDRRRPGTGPLTSPRQELDRVEVLSGLEGGMTLGTPLALWVANLDSRASDYHGRRGAPRPSHADFATAAKYGRAAASGGGRASARETVGRVAAGAVARRLLQAWAGVEVVAWVCRVHDLDADEQLARRQPAVGRGDVDAHPSRCPDPAVADAMAARIVQAGADGDSLGGVVEAVARGVPAGWGEPVFDKLEACLARALLSIPACRGFEVGSGFAGTRMRGSEHNDPFTLIDGRLRAPTNRSGGIQGGISNGEDIVVRAAFKPPASIARPQASVDADGQAVTLAGRGRHDPCVLPRAVPIVEAMVALVLADHMLRQRQQAPGHPATRPPR